MHPMVHLKHIAEVSSEAIFRGYGHCKRYISGVRFRYAVEI